MTAFETLSLKCTEKEWHQDALIRSQPNGYPAAEGKCRFYVTMTVPFRATH